MNTRTEQILSDFQPTLLIAVYEVGREFYLESHNVGSNGKILEGKPLEQETIQGMVDVFFDENKSRSKISGLMPANLLSYETIPGGHYKMIWYRESETRVLHFKDGLNLPAGPANVPAMLYMVDRQDLSVYALVNNNRPELDTILYDAPFYNTSSDGGVCLGNARLAKPEKTYAALMKYWEDLFWLSEFTHLSGDNPTKTNLNLLWARLLADNAVTWDQLDELLPSDEKLKSLLK